MQKLVFGFSDDKTTLAWIVPAPSDVALPRVKKLKTLVRLTSHNILGNRESVANSQPFAQRIGRRPTSSCKNSLMSSGACMPSDSVKRARAPLRLAAFGGKNYN